MRRSIAFLLSLLFVSTSWAQTLQIEDTLLVTSQRWRDTCFGLTNKDATQIPSGYLIDYFLASIDKDFDGTGANDGLKYGRRSSVNHIISESIIDTEHHQVCCHVIRHLALRDSAIRIGRSNH